MEEAEKFANIILSCCHKKDVPILKTNYKEAEAIKLFANPFFAMRVAYYIWIEVDGYPHKY